MLEEGLRRIEYMFHKFSEYVWGLLMDLAQNTVALIDPEAALERLAYVMRVLSGFCERGQRLPMQMGFLAYSVKGVLDPAEGPETAYNEAGRASCIRQLSDAYEVFMLDQRAQSPEEEL